MPMLHYRCADRIVESDDAEATILDISKANGIPHWHACGGNARCTTCRVRVLDGLSHLSPRNDDEARIATARGWDTTIRLACQTHVTGDVMLERMVLSGTDASQLQLEAVGTRGGEEREIAVLFCDLRGFTTLAESHTAFDVVHILDRLFHSLGEQILLHGGVIYQYVGDEISGLFGVDGGHAKRACRGAVRAALGMQEALALLNATLVEEFGIQLRVGIGVHYGPVIVGRVGHPVQKHFAVVGDTVNIASRIQSMNKECGTDVLVSDAVVSKLPEGTISSAATFAAGLRGKAVPVQVHAVTRLTSAV